MLPHRRSAHTKMVRLPDCARATARLAATVPFFSHPGLVTRSVLAPRAAASISTRVRRLRYASATTESGLHSSASSAAGARLRVRNAGTSPRTVAPVLASRSSGPRKRSSRWSRSAAVPIARPRPTTSAARISTRYLGLDGLVGSVAGVISVACSAVTAFAAALVPCPLAAGVGER